MWFFQVPGEQFFLTVRKPWGRFFWNLETLSNDKNKLFSQFCRVLSCDGLFCEDTLCKADDRMFFLVVIVLLCGHEQGEGGVWVSLKVGSHWPFLFGWVDKVNAPDSNQNIYSAAHHEMFTLPFYTSTYTYTNLHRKKNLTSCLNAKVDLAFRRMGDGVATKLHVHADGKQESGSEICGYRQCFA